MKKIFKAIFLILFLLIGVNSLVVNAASVHIIRDENPDGVTTLNIYDNNYWLEIDNETQTAYLCCNSNAGVYIIGICNVSILNYNGQLITQYNNYEQNYLNLGEIVIDFNNSEYGIIYSVSGEINRYFKENNHVYIVE